MSGPRFDRSSGAAILGVLLALGTAGCASAPSTTEAKPFPGKPFVEEGLASWYGEPYHGRTAASGERYDMWAMTAAHRTLPFGTVVRVRRTDTRREATVRINDRGPFVDGRIIDLSRAAAEALGAVGPGVVPVRIQVTSWGGGSPDSSCWEVQAGAFALPENLERARRVLEESGYTVRLLPGSRGLTRVRITGLESRRRAAEVTRRIRSDFPDARPVACEDS